MEFPTPYVNGNQDKPSREELRKRLREKCNRRKENKKPEDSLSTRLAEYTKLPESEIKTLMTQTGTKKLRKHPHKFAKKIAEMLPNLQSASNLIK